MKLSRLNIWMVAVAALWALVATACIVVDEFEPKQRTQIEDYLLRSGLEYRITSDSAFVALAGNKLLTQGESRPAGAQKGDKVNFNVEAYTFASSPANKPYYTNKRYLAEQLSATLDSSNWDFEPYEVTIGDGEVINGVDEALEGSIVGDSLLVFLTSSLAYGSAGMGSVPGDTAVMMILTVEQE